jgi:hypothetical protein
MTSAEEPRTLSFEELTVWRTELPDVKFAVLPPGNTRPNPLIADGTLLRRSVGKGWGKSKIADFALFLLPSVHSSLTLPRHIPKIAP